jgi:transcriptional regulator with XRE-family HTH domain
MRSKVAQAIRNARLACGLTQVQLGRRLGLKGRAVYRWERDDSAPRRRHRAALVTAIQAVNAAAATALAAVFASESKGAAAISVAPIAVAAPAIDPKLALELSIFACADELDVPARRLRSALLRLHQRWRETNLTLDVAQRYLEAWVEPATKG